MHIWEFVEKVAFVFMPLNFKLIYQAALFITVTCHLLRSYKIGIGPCTNLGYLNPLISYSTLLTFLQLNCA